MLVEENTLLISINYFFTRFVSSPVTLCGRRALVERLRIAAAASSLSTSRCAWCGVRLRVRIDGYRDRGYVSDFVFVDFVALSDWRSSERVRVRGAPWSDFVVALSVRGAPERLRSRGAPRLSGFVFVALRKSGFRRRVAPWSLHWRLRVRGAP